MSLALFHFGPHAGAHRIALRAGISVGVPLLLLWAVDRIDWSMYAAFGAFTSLYGRNHVHLSRMTMQATVAVFLVQAVTVGVWVGTLESRSVWMIPLAAGLAAVGALLSENQDWHPPGPLFLIFAFAGCASVPSSLDVVPIAFGVSAGSALFSIVVGTVGVLWSPAPRHLIPRVPMVALLRSAATRLRLFRYFSAVLVSGSIATVIGIGHPYWAMVSAVVPMAARNRAGQLTRAAHRVLGTLLGLVLSAILLSLGASGFALILMIVLLQALAELLVGRNYGLALVFITPLALMMGQLARPQPMGPLLFDRGVETVLGVVVAIALTVLTRESNPNAERERGRVS